VCGTGVDPDFANFAAMLAGLIASIQGIRHGVVMTMGKGGVGKTTVAAAIACFVGRRPALALYRGNRSLPRLRPRGGAGD
jgi:hypothetical protein